MIHVYRVKDCVQYTSNEEPFWKDADGNYRDTVVDNGITWSLRTEMPVQIDLPPFEGADPNIYAIWMPNRPFIIGNSIAVDEVYYTITSFTGCTGDTEPDWSDLQNNQKEDNGVTWFLIDAKSRILNLQWNEHIKINKTYQIMG
jgi:hypothetical protein